jgi:hypothetical protein
MKCQRFAYLLWKIIRFYTLMPKYVSFRSDFVICLLFLNETHFILLSIKVK